MQPLIDYITSRETMAATKFVATMVLLTTSIVYASLLYQRRRAHLLGSVSDTDLLILAIILEMGSAALHQLFWLINEIALARGRCFGVEPVEHICAWQVRMTHHDWLTLICYVGWIAGAFIILWMWLRGLHSAVSGRSALIMGIAGLIVLFVSGLLMAE